MINNKYILTFTLLILFLMIFNYFWLQNHNIYEGLRMTPSIVVGYDVIAGTFTVDTNININEDEWKLEWAKWTKNECGGEYLRIRPLDSTPYWAGVRGYDFAPNTIKIKFVPRDNGEGQTKLEVLGSTNNNDWQSFITNGGNSTVDVAGSCGIGITTGGSNPMKLADDGYYYVSCGVAIAHVSYLLKLKKICKISENDWQDQTNCTSCGPEYTKTQILKITDTKCFVNVPTTRTRPCPCPCTYGDWKDANPNECPECGASAMKTQTRTATDNGLNDCNQPTSRTVSCGLPECECVHNDWDNPPCSKPCGGGTRKLSRTVKRQNDKNTCSDITKNEQCNTQDCPPCDYGNIDQTTLLNCSKICGGGTQIGNLLVINKNGNDICPTKTGTQSCNTQACPPCDYGSIDTSSLSACSVSCGGGTRTGNLTITNKNGNDTCANKTANQSCNEQGCPIIYKTIAPDYDEYWNLYLSNQYNSASYFTMSDQPFTIKNSSFKDNFYELNSRNSEQYRDKMIVSSFAISIDLQGIQLPYITYIYFNHSNTGIAKITNGANAVANLQLNNNNNNFGKVLNAIYINSNGVPNVYYSQIYFLDSTIDTTSYNIYMIVSKKPILMESNRLLSCTTPNVGNNNICMVTDPGHNIAISFTVNLKTANKSTNKQQIIGITTEQNGDEKIVFGAWVCSHSNNLLIQRASASNPQEIISNCKIPLDVGLDCTIVVLCNGKTKLYEIYKNGALIDTMIPKEAPMYITGKCYIYSSFNSYKTVEGTLSDVVLLTSSFKTFDTRDLRQAIDYMNNNIDLTKNEKKIVEEFTGNYQPLENGNYSPTDLRKMESELIQELNNFNREYSNYKKYIYNNRHNVTGDTSQKFTKPDGSTYMPSDFPSLNMNVQLQENPVYMNILNDLKSFNHALDTTVNLSTIEGQVASDMESVGKKHNEVSNMRQNLDQKLLELHELENTLSEKNSQALIGSVYANIMWTALATSLVYYVFVHRK